MLRDAGLKQPDQELPRAAWMSLLGHGHAVAEQQPEQAAVFLDTLWQAAREPSARVCASACCSQLHTSTMADMVAHDKRNL